MLYNTGNFHADVEIQIFSPLSSKSVYIFSKYFHDKEIVALRGCNSIIIIGFEAMETSKNCEIAEIIKNLIDLNVEKDNIKYVNALKILFKMINYEIHLVKRF